MPSSIASAIPDCIKSADTDAVLKWAAEAVPRIAVVTSFAAEGVIVIDMLARLGLTARIVTIDTGRLATESYAVMEAIRDRYGVRVEVLFPMADAVQAMVAEHGVNLFYRSVELRRRCCAVRKVEPLKRGLAELDGWITGLRRSQAGTRRALEKVEIDTDHGGIVKINPLADWSADDVWRYIRTHRVPYNALHDLGYPSIGCAPCTRAVRPEEDSRAGRWWWEEQSSAKECGLHRGPMRP